MFNCECDMVPAASVITSDSVYTAFISFFLLFFYLRPSLLSLCILTAPMLSLSVVHNFTFGWTWNEEVGTPSLPNKKRSLIMKTLVENSQHLLFLLFSLQHNSIMLKIRWFEYTGVNKGINPQCILMKNTCNVKSK
jgi:hypothetical protein